VTRRILVTDHVFGDVEIERAILEPLDARVEVAPAADEETLAGLATGAAGVLVCYARLTARVIEAAAEGGCRVISRYGIGYDNIDIEAASRAGILVTYVPDYCLGEVADHTLALLLAAARNVVSAVESVRAGEWRVPQSGVHALQGRRLALVGVGRIGRMVAERALAFGLRVLAYDPFIEDWDLPQVERASSLHAAVADADFISLHAPLTPENRHLIDAGTIALMRRRPILINTSRGGLVDLEAVLGALYDGRLAAVALDVVEPEPLPPAHPLRVHPRAIVTPHMSFYSAESQAELQRRAAEEVARALSGKPPRCPVNADVLQAR
jgi:D-3-phosphoglycerate dehydrogenase